MRNINAQSFVTIPDAIFLNYLQTKVPLAVYGNSLQITNTMVTTCQSINVKGKGITDLTGIQYFTSLTDLNCDINYLSALPPLPTSLITLSCSHNSLTSLPSLPGSLERLTCDHNLLTTLPELPNSLQYLFCNDNKIYCFPFFPSSLKSVQYWYNSFYYCIDLSNNPFVCLPNYLPSVMQASLSTYPICTTSTSLCKAAIGVEEFKQKTIDISLFPNPNSGSFKLNIENENCEFVLFNTLGQKVHEQKLSHGENSIITNDISKGLYNYKILQDKIQIGAGKIAIE